MFVTPWFMCAFTALPLWDTTLAIWDLLFWTGRKAIFRGFYLSYLICIKFGVDCICNMMYCQSYAIFAVSIAIMETCKIELIAAANLGEILPYLQHLPAEKLHSATFVPKLWSITEAEIDIAIATVSSAIDAGLSVLPVPNLFWICTSHAGKHMINSLILKMFCILYQIMLNPTLPYSTRAI